jgi:LmbE family N-acetylglucosaminyl deacetylase
MEMLKFKFATKKERTLKILCLGAHSDDIEIGCGGTMLRILSENDNVEVHWIVFGSNEKRDDEAIASANAFLAKANKKEIMVENFKNGFFPYIGSEIKNYFEKLKKIVSPDIVFTHYRHDLHQDHRLVSDLTWNTFRDNFILEYEIVKYDGDLGVPNFFIHLNKKVCNEKIQCLMKFFKTQTGKDWFTEDTFLSMMRIRGIESKAPEKYAEGFYCRKGTL